MDTNKEITISEIDACLEVRGPFLIKNGRIEISDRTPKGSSIPIDFDPRFIIGSIFGLFSEKNRDLVEVILIKGFVESKLQWSIVDEKEEIDSFLQLGEDEYVRQANKRIYVELSERLNELENKASKVLDSKSNSSKLLSKAIEKIEARLDRSFQWFIDNKYEDDILLDPRINRKINVEGEVISIIDSQSLPTSRWEKEAIRLIKKYGPIKTGDLLRKLQLQSMPKSYDSINKIFITPEGKRFFEKQIINEGSYYKLKNPNIIHDDF